MKKTRYIPYGYSIRDGKTIIDHDEAKVIQKIFDSYVNGDSLKDIAESLTAQKLPYTERIASERKEHRKRNGYENSEDY